MTRIPVGKLPSGLLKDLLHRYTRSDPRVIVGPGIGRDAAIIDMGGSCLVAKTDPVTFATDEIGRYAVHINANDVACCGATPRWFLATILFADQGSTTELAESIFSQIDEACRELNISLCGGHTEVTYDLPRTIVIGQMLGEVSADSYVTTCGAKVGDALIVTKGIAVEGTAIIAREKRETLGSILSPADIKRCANLLREPGISVVKDAKLALQTGGVHALHDPTEGGIATGLWELAEAAEVGVLINEKRLPILPECRTICHHLDLDPLGLIASGSLLISAQSDCADAILRNLSAARIDADVIGKVVPASEGCSIHGADGSVQPLPVFPCDEIARLFE